MKRFNWNQTGMPMALVKNQRDDLIASLANAEKNLEDANRRYERLVAELAKHRITISEKGEVVTVAKKRRRKSKSAIADQAPSVSDPSHQLTEWEEWDLKFRSLLG